MKSLTKTKLYPIVIKESGYEQFRLFSHFIDDKLIYLKNKQ